MARSFASKAMLIVIGIDSLDAERIQKFETPNLDLNQNGMMHTPEGLESGELRTKVLWPSMLIGKHPSDIYPGYPYPTGTNSGEWNVGLLNNPVVGAMENVATSVLQRSVQKRIVEAFGSAGVDRQRPHHEFESLLDVAENPRPISIPGYNEDESNTELKDMLTHPEGDWSTMSAESTFEAEAAAADAHRMFRTLTAIRSRQHDLVWTHLFSLDPVQHLWATDERRMRRWHRWYDDYLGMVLDESDEDDTVVVVSDHGMNDNGMHSKRAYYACSKSICDSEEFRMVELRDVLEAELKHHDITDGESKGERLDVDRETMDHLQELGYAE